MERIVLEVSEISARRWNALSREEQEGLTRLLEDLVLQLIEDNSSAAEFPKTVNESETVYKTTQEKREQRMRQERMNELFAFLEKQRQEAEKRGFNDDFLQNIMDELANRQLWEIMKKGSKEAAASGLTQGKLNELLEHDD